MIYAHHNVFRAAPICFIAYIPGSMNFRLLYFVLVRPNASLAV